MRLRHIARGVSAALVMFACGVGPFLLFEYIPTKVVLGVVGGSVFLGVAWLVAAEEAWEERRQRRRDRT